MAPSSVKRRASQSHCPHLDLISPHKRTKILDLIWANLHSHVVTLLSPLFDDVAQDGCDDEQDHKFACMACDRRSPSAAGLKAAHGKRTSGHELALDTSNSEIFCTVCEDYVYCSEIDRAVAAMLASKRQCTMVPDQPAAQPTTTAAAAAAAAATVAAGCGALPQLFTPLPRSEPFQPGLRGLNNMGHTCFMNSILQALVHSPMLRDYHLGHSHARAGCAIAAEGGFCIACELDSLFSAVYCGDRSPHSPSAFLHAWWMLAGGALGGGCKQQDAHEFFLFILEMLGAVGGRDSVVQRLFGGCVRSDVVCSACGAASTTRDQFMNLSLDIPPPRQILPPPVLPRANHNLVNGKAGAAASKAGKQLVGAAKAAHQARIHRQSSGGAANRSTQQFELTPEPSSQVLDDASLSELTSMATQQAPAAGETGGRFDDATADTLSSPQLHGGLELPKQTAGPAAIAAHPALAGYLHWPGASLVGCLRRFVWPEDLGHAEQWSCSGCGAQQGAVKQMSLELLPPVLVLHAKRFEHAGGARATAKKLDTFLSFPLENLDMTPFLTAQALKGRHVARPSTQQGSDAASPAVSSGSGLQPVLRGAALRRARSHGNVAADVSAAAASRSAPAAVSLGVESAGTEACDCPAPLFDLFAVVCHRGTFQGGHYVAYVRAGDGRWYLCDDAYVAPVSEEVVRTCQAYMLFFAQQDLTPWKKKNRAE